uniref:Uncharacterized protein n=1 Tax=Glossina brevipalpis TaxID=37001 RepID=A0A1A9WBZ1_9MUSC
MSDSDTMRTTGPIRPTFPGGVPPRTVVGPTRPIGSPATVPVRSGQPPPLRPTDSRVNVLMGSGAPPARPVGSPQIRNATPMSPTGQGGPRAESTIPWQSSVPGQPSQNRPQNMFPGSQQELSPITKTSDLSLTSPESISNEKQSKKLSIEISKNDLNAEKLKKVEIYQGDNDSGVDESTQEKGFCEKQAIGLRRLLNTQDPTAPS